VQFFRLRSEVNTVEYVQVPVGTSIADMERAMIMATLKRCGGNKTRTAAMLGVSLKTLYNRLNAYRALDMADLPGERIEVNESSAAEKIA
jgi:DNA-binding NtrC family response regulator